MKCIQGLCQRTKNLKLSGYCNICDDLIEELKKKHEAVERQRTFSRVEIDFRLLKDTHEKLINGNKVLLTYLLNPKNTIYYLQFNTRQPYCNTSG